jgi:anti-sigma factor RsiW
MSACTVSAVALDAYAEGDVTDAEAFALEAHVLGCELCQTWLAPRSGRRDAVRSRPGCGASACPSTWRGSWRRRHR